MAEFDYDALGRRIRKYDGIADANTFYYYNYNWQVLCEYGYSGTPERWYAYGNYIDEVLIMSTSANVSDAKFYIQDHLYSPAALIDSSGNVIERYEYDAYGQPYIMDALYNARSSSSYGNPYYFTGRRLDVLDNGNLTLQYNRYRYFDYYTGRWLTQDPQGYTDGMNLYEYGGSNPLIRIDLYGLKWEINRKRPERRAEVVGGCDDTIDDLARETGMDPRYFRNWLVPTDSKPLPKSPTEKLNEPKRTFTVPNTVIVALGEMNWLLNYLSRGVAFQANSILKQKGFYVLYYDFGIRPWSSSSITWYHRDLYGLVGFGHGQFGKGGKLNMLWSSPFKGYWRVRKDPEDILAPYQFANGQFGLLVLKICFAAQATPSWKDTVSQYGAIWLGSGWETGGMNFGIIDTVMRAR